MGTAERRASTADLLAKIDAVTSGHETQRSSQYALPTDRPSRYLVNPNEDDPTVDEWNDENEGVGASYLVIFDELSDRSESTWPWATRATLSGLFTQRRFVRYERPPGVDYERPPEVEYARRIEYARSGRSLTPEQALAILGAAASMRTAVERTMLEIVTVFAGFGDAIVRWAAQHFPPNPEPSVPVPAKPAHRRRYGRG